MIKKINSKIITSEIPLINSQLKDAKLSQETKKNIERHILFIKNILKDIVEIKKIGSYAINNIYKFDEFINVDLLALKFINKNMYFTYQEEVTNKEHFSDCWICEINEVIFTKLQLLNKQNPKIIVEWNISNTKRGRDSFISFNDSIKISIYEKNSKPLSFFIRTTLLHSKYPPIFCDRNIYQITHALEYVEMYKILNKLLLKKLELLFLYIRLKKETSFSKKEYLLMKLYIMGDIQYQLSRNKVLNKWLTHVFKYIFPSVKVIDDLFNSKYIHYKKQKLLEKMYSSFKIKNLSVVFNRTFPKTKVFLKKYLLESKMWIKEKKYLKENIYFWYDSVVYLNNSTWSTSLTKKKAFKKYDDLNINTIIKNVYPSDNNIGIFLIMLIYYPYKINFLNNER